MWIYLSICRQASQFMLESYAWITVHHKLSFCSYVYSIQNDVEQLKINGIIIKNTYLSRKRIRNIRQLERIQSFLDSLILNNISKMRKINIRKVDFYLISRFHFPVIYLVIIARKIVQWSKFISDPQGVTEQTTAKWNLFILYNKLNWPNKRSVPSVRTIMSRLTSSVFHTN